MVKTIGVIIRWTLFLFVYAYSMIVQRQILEQWNWKRHCKNQVMPSILADCYSKKTFSEWEEYWQQKANDKHEEKEHHTILIWQTVSLWFLNLIGFFALGIFLMKGWWFALLVLSLSLIKAIINFKREIGNWKYKEFDDE